MEFFISVSIRCGYNAAAKGQRSQIAHTESEDYFEKIIAKPRFLSKAQSSAVERGSAHHLFLQYCDFTKAPESIEEEITRLKAGRAF